MQLLNCNHCGARSRRAVLCLRFLSRRARPLLAYFEDATPPQTVRGIRNPTIFEERPSFDFDIPLCTQTCRLHVVHTDDYSSMATFTSPPHGASLTAGFREHKSRCDRDPHHSHPNRLDRICHMHLESKSAGEISGAQVVTWRGIMKK